MIPADIERFDGDHGLARCTMRHWAYDKAANQDSGDTNATRDSNQGGTRLLVVRITHAYSASSGVEMKRLFVAVGVVAAGLLA
jgi:hypothetical protein